MKFLRYMSFILFSCVVFSCSDDNGNDPEVTPLKPVDGLTAPNNQATYELNSNLSDYITFEWKKDEVKSSSSPVYEVVFIKKGGDFNAPIGKIKSDNSGIANKAKISHQQLDKIWKDAGVAEGEESTLVWSVLTSLNQQKLIATVTREITLTRSAPFVVPTALFITGEGSETGTTLGRALEYKKLSSGVFEIFTKLEAGKNYKIIDAREEGTLRSFYVKDGKIEQGIEQSKVSKTGVYRISVDFNTTKVSLSQVTNLGLFYCIHNRSIADLKYIGEGVWSLDDIYMFFSKEGWGLEDRYKFQMELLEANGTTKKVFWGTKYATDSGPSGDAAYFEVAESSSNELWDDKWKFKSDLHKKYMKVTVSLKGNQSYTHSIEKVNTVVNWGELANRSTTSFLDAFWNSKGHFNNDTNGNVGTYDYWPEAHAADVIIDGFLRTNSSVYKQYIYNFYEGVKKKNGNRFYNNYYDDMAWHGLTHLRAFEATNDSRYEESARDLWHWIAEGWNDYDGGGIPWNHDNTNEGKGKGVPSNGPSTIIAIRRWVKYGNSEIVQGENDLQWAKKIYSWMRNNRYEPETGRVFEKKDDKGGDWTYNAGTFMGAAMELYDVTKEQIYFDDAVRTADYALANLSGGGVHILSDWAEQQDHDVNLFKAIFIRYFTRLIMYNNLPEDKRKEYIDFMLHCANSLRSRGAIYEPYVLYSHRWWEKPKDPNKIFLRAQISGCTLIEAMALLEKKGYLK